MKKIKAGSFSSLHIFEQCKYRAKLARIDKIPEPDRGLPHAKCPTNPETNKREWHNDRGNRVHEHAEGYVKGTLPDPCYEMRHFKTEFQILRNEYEAGNISAEKMWCFDKNWNSIDSKDHKNITFRLIIDCLCWKSDIEVIVIDYKTGQKYGNEVTHAEQLQLYAAFTALKFPELEIIHTEDWYLDQDDISGTSFTRSEALRFLRSWQFRNQEMLNCEKFPPNPNIFSCKWCPYSRKRSGDCSVGVLT